MSLLYIKQFYFKGKTMQKFVKTALLMVAIGMVTAGLLSGCDKKNDNLVTAKIFKGDIVEKITASGIINPISTVNIGTQVSGIIAEIYVDYNTKVDKGQLLALIDPQTFEATVDQRQAALDIAKAELEVTKNDIVYYKKHLDRIKKLNRSQYSTDKELESAQRDYSNAVAQKALKEAEIKQAEAALNQAQIDLEYTRIISSVDGVVISREVEVGQTVAASFNTPTLFNVAEDLTKMQIEASVVEADIAKIRDGQKVEFSVDSFPDEVFEGVVSQVRNNPITTSNVVTYEVIISIDNQALKLKPGMTANVEIITAEKKDVLLAPNKALRFYVTDENGEIKRYQDKGIWILRKGKPTRINVITGIADDDFTEVFSEQLKDGDEVILEDKKETEKRAARLRLRR